MSVQPETSEAAQAAQLAIYRSDGNVAEIPRVRPSGDLARRSKERP
jgi:hypothetical protein